MNKKSLPISLNLIGWYHTIVGLIVLGASILLLFLNKYRFETIIKDNQLELFGNQDLNVLSTLFIFLLIIASFTTSGVLLLKISIYGWLLSLLIGSIGIFIWAIEWITTGEIPRTLYLTYNFFVIWKLYEHRNLFLKKNA